MKEILITIIIVVFSIVLFEIFNKKKSKSVCKKYAGAGSSCDDIFNPDKFRPAIDKTRGDTSGFYSLIANFALSLLNEVMKSDLVRSARFKVKDSAGDSILNEIILDEQVFKYTIPVLGRDIFVNLDKVTGINDSLTFKKIYQLQEDFGNRQSSIHTIYGIITLGLSFKSNIKTSLTGAESFTVDFNPICGEALLKLQYWCGTGTTLINVELSHFKILNIEYSFSNPIISSLATVASIFADITKMLTNKLQMIVNGTNNVDDPNVLRIVNCLINKRLPISFPNIIGCLDLPKLIVEADGVAYNGLVDWSNTKNLPQPDGKKMADCVGPCVFPLGLRSEFCQNLCVKKVLASKIGGTQEDCAKICNSTQECTQFDYIPETTGEVKDQSYCFIYDSKNSYIPAEPFNNPDYIINFKKIDNVDNRFVVSPDNKITIFPRPGLIHENFNNLPLKPYPLAQADCALDKTCSVLDVKTINNIAMGHAYLNNENPGELICDNNIKASPGTALFLR